MLFINNYNNVCVLLTAVSSPNVDSYVFVKVVNDVAGIVIEEEAGDAGYEYFTLLTVVGELNVLS